MSFTQIDHVFYYKAGIYYNSFTFSSLFNIRTAAVMRARVFPPIYKVWCFNSSTTNIFFKGLVPLTTKTGPVPKIGHFLSLT